MENIYTEQNITKFFEGFKSLQNSYKIEKVHQLLNNPDAKATHRVTHHFKHLKLIIMTSAFIIGAATLFIWFTPKNPNTERFNNNMADKPAAYAKKKADSSIEIKSQQEYREIDKLKIGKVKPKDQVQDYQAPISDDAMMYVSGSEPNKQAGEIKNSSICSWPSDTIIDKDLLLVNLTDKELMKLGVARKGFATSYHNVIEGYYDMSLTCSPDLIPQEDRKTTHNKFFVAYHTNSYFEPEGPSNFYSSMDTLVPVVTNNKAGHIFWFTPHDSFFELLPNRYSYLKEVYANLKCLKKNYPNKTFTNFLTSGNEIILESINYLKLNKKELQKIGVRFEDESIIFQSKNKKYTQKITSNGSTYSVGTDEDFAQFPPNPYPVAMTDTLGHRFFVHRTIVEKDSLSKIMNILVPVRINLNEVIPPNQDVMICWYYPTEDFLNALPEEIGNELKSEVEVINNDSQVPAKSCTYYEVCKSTLQLDNFKLYPNPASYSVSIEFNLGEEVEGSISIVNIVGARLKTLVPNSTFLSGRNTYQMDLSGITPGIYLISVNTDKGFKTQRLIVSQ